LLRGFHDLIQLKVFGIKEISSEGLIVALHFFVCLRVYFSEKLSEMAHTAHSDPEMMKEIHDAPK